MLTKIILWSTSPLVMVTDLWCLLQPTAGRIYPNVVTKCLFSEIQKEIDTTEYALVIKLTTDRCYMLN